MNLIEQQLVVSDRLTKYAVGLKGANYYIKKEIMNKTITIHLAKECIINMNDSEFDEYVSKQVKFWTSKVRNQNIYELQTGKRIEPGTPTQKKYSEKKIFKRGERRDYMRMKGADRIEKTLEINKRLYGIQCELENVKVDRCGMYYIMKEGLRAYLVEFEGIYMLPERAQNIRNRRQGEVKEVIEAVKQQQKQSDQIINQLELKKEDKELLKTCITMDTAKLQNFMKRKFANLKTGKKEVITKEDVKKELNYDIKENNITEKNHTDVQLFTDAYNCDWFFDVCSPLREKLAPKLSNVEWDLVCYTVFQLYLGYQSGDTRARVLARYFPVFKEILVVCSMLRNVVLNDDGISVACVPYEMESFGSKQYAYTEGYINSHVKLKDSKVFDDVTKMFAGEQEGEEVYTKRYWPRRLLCYFESQGLGNVVWKCGFASQALFIIGSKVDDSSSITTIHQVELQRFFITQLPFLNKDVTSLEDYHESRKGKRTLMMYLKEKYNCNIGEVFLDTGQSRGLPSVFLL